MKKIIVAALVVMGVVGTAHAEGNAKAGQNLATSKGCVGCHGMDGNSMIPGNPKLAGQGAGYLAKQMADFKANTRKGTVMNGMSAGLSDQNMADIAAYFAGQTIKVGSGNKDLVKAGEKLYRGGDKENGVSACIACHGPTGAGMPSAKFPALGGQHAAYIAKELESFRTGKRSNDTGKMMQDIAAKMSEAQMKAVSEYIAGLYAN
ncbi:MAG: cytochrome c4 [Gammaproteobacteria bacterium]|nr:cytochrome c4 [Gammaproteobacteria bacterium]